MSLDRMEFRDIVITLACDKPRFHLHAADLMQ